MQGNESGWSKCLDITIIDIIMFGHFMHFMEEAFYGRKSGHKLGWLEKFPFAEPVWVTSQFVSFGHAGRLSGSRRVCVVETDTYWNNPCGFSLAWMTTSIKHPLCTIPFKCLRVDKSWQHFASCQAKPDHDFLHSGIWGYHDHILTPALGVPNGAHEYFFPVIIFFKKSIYLEGV